MRPINKGVDRGDFDPYQDAQQPLIDQLGEFCSYCERWVSSGIHVEHKLPKGRYKNEVCKWTNFLLSCMNCNSGKASGELILTDYLWPDTDNTFRVFTYDAEGRVKVSLSLSGQERTLANATWKMVNLNRHPDVGAGFEKPTTKDNRWLHRSQDWKIAINEKKSLEMLSNHPKIAYFKEKAVNTAAQRGLFSIWMSVFESDIEMKNLLIQKFQGTASDCFDDNGDAVARPGGQI